jgi:hypothetical protein
MGLFRALNLLQAIENQGVLGAALETALNNSVGQEAEFGAMLSTRHMSRRMAGNPITMAAINSSNAAINLVFTNTSEYNFRPIEEIAKNQAAIEATALILLSIQAAVNNATAWSYFRASSYYEDNAINIVSTLIARDPADFTTKLELVEDSPAMSAISVDTGAMRALVASPDLMTLVAQNRPAIVDIMSNAGATTIVANDDASVHLFAQSTIAIDELTDQARAIVLSIPSALFIVGSYPVSWQTILDTSTTLATNIHSLLIAFGGLDSEVFQTVADIFADNAASTTIANSRPAMMAVIAEPTAFSTLVASNNLGAVLGSSVAMAEITGNTAAMNTLIGNSDAFPTLLASSAAKAAIFSTPALFTTMMTPASTSLATVQGSALSATVVNNASIGTFKSVGVAGNIIILTGVMGSIVATTLENKFRGTGQAEFAIGLPGTSLSSGPKDINLPFTDAEWDITSIAATAAGNVTITYVDFN